VALGFAEYLTRPSEAAPLGDVGVHGLGVLAVQGLGRVQRPVHIKDNCPDCLIHEGTAPAGKPQFALGAKNVLDTAAIIWETIA